MISHYILQLSLAGWCLFNIDIIDMFSTIVSIAARFSFTPLRHWCHYHFRHYYVAIAITPAIDTTPYWCYATPMAITAISYADTDCHADYAIIASITPLYWYYAITFARLPLISYYAIRHVVTIDSQ